MSRVSFPNLIKNSEHLDEYLVHHERIPETEAVYAEPVSSLTESYTNGLNNSGISALYSHQAEAFDLVKQGNNIVAVTPTASGKSLLYNLPVLEKLSDEGGCAIYLFPLKALEQDQLKKIRKLTADLSIDISAEIYDGDTPTSKRAKIRKNPPEIVITNPDMLHLSLMSYHSSWEDLFRKLKFVVIDELHVYRGVFGSQILHVLHRLTRLCSYYGSSPQFITTSATIAGADELAKQLTGLNFKVINTNGAPASEKHFLFFNPQISYLTFSLNLFIAALKSGLRAIVFCKSRRGTELLQMWLNNSQPKLSKSVSSYRAGFLPEERRQIESRLLSGNLKGVITTSALELGIDIGGLDVCILVGYPGTISSTWQRAGRVGRDGHPATICLVAGQDQLDQYFMRNPSDFFSRPVEKAIVDPTNEYMMRSHLVCAAQEVPIDSRDFLWESEIHKPVIKELEGSGKLLLGANGDRYFAAQRRPHREVDIRSAGDQFTIENIETGKSLGSTSGRAVFAECHPGAIYLHQGRQYFVEELDTEQKRVKAKPIKANHYTVPLFEKETEILEEYEQRSLTAGSVKFVKLKVTEQLVGYQKRKFTTQELLSQHELEYPPHSYNTIGLAVLIPQDAAKIAARRDLHFRGGIHGVEHALLALAPLYALCDRSDMGGYSQLSHPQLECPSVFLYDGFPGGIGLAKRVFEVFPELLERTLTLVETCECETGCPSCIHSPKCGHGNIPLDKRAAILTMQVLTGRQILSDPRAELVAPLSIPLESSVSSDSDKTKPVKSEAPVVETPQRWPSGKSGVVFDLETQRSAEEVGGWGNIRAMGLAWAVVYKFPEGEWLHFPESKVDDLVDTLSKADLVIGFNHIRFDYEVLRGYSGFDFRKLADYDILKEISGVLGHRLKLNSVASATLGVGKTADGLQSLEWWKNGEVEQVAEYCQKDVEVTRDVFFYLLENEYLLFEKKGIGLVRIPLAETLKRIDAL